MIPKKMKAVVMTGVGNVELHEYDVPTPAPDQILLETKAASSMFRYDANSSATRMAFGPIIFAFKNAIPSSLEINWSVNGCMIFFLSDFRLIKRKHKSAVCYCATNYTIIANGCSYNL